MTGHAEPAGLTSRVAVVVVAHDTRDETLACLATLPEAGAHETVVVDTGSRDATVAAVRETHPDVLVVCLPNVGYGRAANAGAARTDAPVLGFVNPDTRFAPGSLTALARRLDTDPGIAAAGPRVRYPDGSPQPSARRLPTLAQAAGHAALGLWRPANRWTRAYHMRDADPGVARDVDWLSGCALVLRRDAFVAVGGFDRGFFMYGEDVDLGWRLRQAGWRLAYEPAAEVTHRVGAATRQRPAAMVVAHARSLDRLYGRAYATGPARALRPLVRAGLVAWVAVALLRHRLPQARP